MEKGKKSEYWTLRVRVIVCVHLSRLVAFTKIEEQYENRVRIRMCVRVFDGTNSNQMINDSFSIGIVCASVRFHMISMPMCARVWACVCDDMRHFRIGSVVSMSLRVCGSRCMCVCVCAYEWFVWLSVVICFESCVRSNIASAWVEQFRIVFVRFFHRHCAKLYFHLIWLGFLFLLISLRSRSNLLELWWLTQEVISVIHQHNTTNITKCRRLAWRQKSCPKTMIWPHRSSSIHIWASQRTKWTSNTAR